MPKRVPALQALKALAALDEYKDLERPDSYVESRAGRYVLMLENLVDAANEARAYTFTHDLLKTLLGMTKVGRAKADVNVSGDVRKLRESIPFEGMSDDELASLLGRFSAAGGTGGGVGHSDVEGSANGKPTAAVERPAELPSSNSPIDKD